MNYEEAHKFIYNDIGDEGYTLLNYIAEDKMKDAIDLIIKLTNCQINDAKAIWVDLKCDYGTPETNPLLEPSDLSPAEIARVNREAQEALNKPKCPICGSMNLTKISTVGKVAKVGFFGIFGAGDIGKTWKCNNCGSKF